MSLKPLGERVILKLVEAEEKNRRRHCPSRHRKGKAPKRGSGSCGEWEVDRKR